MPEFNVLHLAMIGGMTVVGIIVGWVLRGNRSRAEKQAVSAGWQEQINAQRKEHDRLTEQNKGLMEQINQYQASNMDAKNRAKELSEAVREAFARRDELQREIKDIRANLELSMSEREQLQSNISQHASNAESLKEKDARIARLQEELKKWQGRLPPLIENFRQRNEDATRLEAELKEARIRIADLEAMSEPSHTRIEPVSDPDALTDGRDASNEALDDEDLIDPAELEAEFEAEDDTDFESDSDEETADDEQPEFAQEKPVNGARDGLQAIKGIGPAIEKTLNEMGIFSFQQIAEMSEYDIDRVAKRLKGFRSRIYREDWIGQARDLRDQEASG
jgi:predicted flap endonuclease-1-like 5' DNA nuclease/cell fate (sporulation/competence/biofilm development) regulator YmcA (YheA/YmcA/DUF963 family)